MSTLKPFLAPLIVAVLALLGLSGVQDTTFREHIEGRLTDSSREALSAAGVDAAQVAFVGRDATVEADTAAAAAAAGAVVRDVTGVRVVRALGPDGEVDLDAVAVAEADDAEGAAGADGSVSDGSAGDDSEEADGSGQSGGGDGSEDGSDDGDADSDRADDDSDGSSDDSDTDADADAEDARDTRREPTKKEQAAAQDDLVEIPNITFVTDSARLTREGKKVVRQAARVLEEHPDVRVRIEGHTDSVGDADENLKLSKRRALTVLNRLVDLGVDEDRLSYRGFGESRPLVAPMTFADLETNRRVEFIVHD